MQVQSLDRGNDRSLEYLPTGGTIDKLATSKTTYVGDAATSGGGACNSL